jgi:hypothetical protein
MDNSFKGHRENAFTQPIVDLDLQPRGLDRLTGFTHAFDAEGDRIPQSVSPTREVSAL